MAPKSLQILLAENREAKKILAELGALLGAAQPQERNEFMAIIASKTVGELATEVPNAIRVFEKLGIDYCCGGQKPLQQACASLSLSVDEVLRALDQSTGTPVDRDWSSARLSELVDHIIEKHHAYVKNELPRLKALLARVIGVHGDNHAELRELELAFLELANELSAHLMKEEQILFPYLKQMASGGSCGPNCFGTVQNPIRVMMMEHDSAGEQLRKMRQTTENYAVPGDACLSYKTLFNALLEFERDLHQHIHLENNILFPRAIELEGHVPTAP